MACDIVALLLLLVAVAASQPTSTADGQEPGSQAGGHHISGIDPGNFTAIHLAYASYCPSKELEQWNCQWCPSMYRFVGISFDNVTGERAFVAYSSVNKTIVVSYRGSVTTRNWIADFNFIKVSYPDGHDVRVHDGFFKAFNDTRANMRKYVAMAAQACPDCNTILATGHSLGAAVAGLSILDLAAVPVAGTQNYTFQLSNFGMPRVGDQAYAELFRQRVFPSTRVVHNHDPVPHLPFEDMGFHHVYTEVWAQSSDAPNAPQNYTLCDGTGEDPTCSRSVPVYELKAEDHDTYLGIYNNGCHS
eukprot:m.177815 g.177815  ORF g.177815 m.177815 type:complete len:303 (+) comp17971_c1_seq1:312-1220(+)